MSCFYVYNIEKLREVLGRPWQIMLKLLPIFLFLYSPTFYLFSLFNVAILFFNVPFSQICYNIIAEKHTLL